MCKISNKLALNIKEIEEKLDRCDDVVKKELVMGGNQGVPFYVVYTDGLVNDKLVDEFIIAPLLLLEPVCKGEVLEQVEKYIVQTADFKEIFLFEDAFTQILSGNTLVFFEHSDVALQFSTKELPSRGVNETQSEVTIRGAKDSFNESLRTGTALIRKRIRDTNLKVEQSKLGRRSKTDIALLYEADIVRPEVLESVKEGLGSYEIDGVLDSGMAEQLLEKDWHSVFPMIQHTERPDKVASSIMEGRIAMVVDNSPGVLLLPATMNTFFQASDDYYNQPSVATFAIPNESFTEAFRIVKFSILIASGIWGIYGFFLSLLVLFIHLCSLESFGIPYLMPLINGGSLDYVECTLNFIDCFWNCLSCTSCNGGNVWRNHGGCIAIPTFVNDGGGYTSR